MSIATTIYDENVEWVFSGAATLNPADNGSPHTGLLDMRATASLAGDTGQWKAPAPLNASSFVNLSVWIQKTGIWTTTTSSVAFFWLDPNGNQVGNVVVIQNGTYGFSSSNAAYQNVVIPAADFGLPANAQVQSLAFQTGTKTSLNYFLDTIVLTSVAVICKPSNLIAVAKCFPCLTPKQTANIRSLLLSQFVPCVPVGGGSPVIGCNAPLAPNNLSTSNNTASSFIVSWQQPVGGVNVSQYLIIWSKFASLFTPSKRSGFATVSGSTLSYTITGLSPSTTYFVEVIALNSLCQSPASASVSQTTLSGTNGLLNSLVFYFNMDVLTGGGIVTDNISAAQLVGLNGGADSSLVAGILNNSVLYNGAAGLNGMYGVGPNSASWIADTGISQTYQTWIWVNAGQTGATPGIVSFWEAAGASQYGYLYITAASGIVHWVWENAASGQISLDAGAAVSTGAWHHLVYGYDATNARLFMYIDGGAIQTTAMASVKPFSNGFAVGLFNLRSTSNEFNGRVDEFAVWHNRVLNATDVANLYNGGAALPYGSFTN